MEALTADQNKQTPASGGEDDVPSAEQRRKKFVATVSEDLKDPPSWATVRGSHSFRHTGAGGQCWEVDQGEHGPVLIRRTKLRPRHPAYVIPHRLWRKIVEAYPDLDPHVDEEACTYTGRYFRDVLWRHILKPCYEEARHSFVTSASTGNAWHVAFVPRRWLEVARDRMVEDGTLEEFRAWGMR